MGAQKINRSYLNIFGMVIWPTPERKWSGPWDAFPHPQLCRQTVCRELVWRTYLAADNQTGGTHQCKRIGGGPWGTMIKVFMARSWRSRMSPSQSPPISRITSSSFAAELSKHTGINNYPIGLVDKPPSYDLLSHLATLRYCSSVRRTLAFDCLSEVSITWPWRTGTRCLGLWRYPCSWSVNSDKRRFAS